MLAEEHVPQMAPAPSAPDLGPQSIGVGQSLNGTDNLVIEAWPPAP
jgi:hypothetical protein